MDITEILKKVPALNEFDIEQVKRGIEVEAEHKDVTKGDPVLTARIVLAHLKEKPNYYKLLDKYVESEKTNSSQKPKIFYAKHIEKGVARYEDEDIFIDDEFLKKIMPTFEGCPVYVYHQGVDYSKIQEEADGYISESFYNPFDGWFWVKFIVVSDKGHEAVSKKWGVSNAYMPTKSEGAGVWHNIEYNRKITDGYYTHLAIVPDPRYEASIIYTPEEFKEYNKSKEVTNNKNKNGGFIVKLFRRKKEEIAEIKNQSDLSDVEVEVDGKEVKLTEMIEALKAQDSEKTQKINEDQEVDVGDKKMKISEVISAYKNMCAKKNEEDAEKKKLEEKQKKNAEDELKAKKNAEDEEKKKKEEEEKKNRLNAEQEKINALKKAEIENSKEFIIETSETKESRGKNRYGSSK